MTEPAMTSTVTEDDDGFEWAIIEVFGHRRLAGRAREEERFGSKLLRIDVPKFEWPDVVEGEEPPNEPQLVGWITSFYGGAALFSFTPSDEATVTKVNRPYRPTGRYTMPALTHDDNWDEE